MDYKEAIKHPKGGAVKMNAENMLASVCRSIAEKYVLGEESLFKWAKKYKYEYLDLIWFDIAKRNFLVALINDKPIGWFEKQ